MRIAGVDIGFTRKSPLALVVLEMDGSAPVLVSHCVFRPAKDTKSWEEAIDYIGANLSECFSVWGFDGHELSLLAYELPHVASNMQTTIKLAHLCGIVRNIARLCDIDVVGVQPAQAKAALAGHGGATKEDMVRMARLQFGVDLSEHEADACGVALAGAMLAKNIA